METELRRFGEKAWEERGWPRTALHWERLAGDGSRRRFWRVGTAGEHGPSMIAMTNPPVNKEVHRENRAYLMIGRHLLARDVPVPRIYSYRMDRGWFVMEDLGTTSLQERVAEIGDPLPLYERVVGCLFRVQTKGAVGFDPSWCHQTAVYDEEVMRRHETDYFKNAFLHVYLGLKKEWPELEPSFRCLTAPASRAPATFFLHRDFQSRNILLPGDRIGIIDWQGARFGPLAYDFASLVNDPYVDLPGGVRSALYRKYVNLLKSRNPEWAESFERAFPYIAVLRALQVLGAFGFLIRVMGKSYFEAYIPPALRTLKDLVARIQDHELAPFKELLADLDSQKGLDRAGDDG